jgi:hypothetical protein
MNVRRFSAFAAVVVGTVLLSIGLQASAAFTQPTGSPPTSDAYAPLNDGPSGQAKQGGLQINTQGATNGLIVQSGRVGFGTANPTDWLQVIGDAQNVGIASTRYNTTGGGLLFLQHARGTLAAPSAVLVSDETGKLLFSGFDGANFISSAAVVGIVDGSVGAGSVPTALSFQTGSPNRTELMRITSNGNVGIGTNAPSSKLDIERTASDGGEILRIGDLGLATTNYDFSRDRVSGALLIQGNEAGRNSIVLAPSSGKVGIGISSPVQKLDVAGNVNIPTGSCYMVNGVCLAASGAGPAGPTGPAGPAGATGATGATGTSPFSLSGTTAFYNAGNVGIGTAGPLSTLSVGGVGVANAGIYGKGATYGAYIDSAGYGIWVNGATAVHGQATATGVEGYGTSVNGVGVYGQGGAKGLYGVGTSIGIQGQGGTVGVGGFGTTYGVSGSTSGINSIAVSGDNSGTNGIGVKGQSTGAGTSWGVYGYGNTYDFYAAGPGIDYGTASSIRYKKNVSELTGALNNVMKLKGVSFDWDKAHGGEHAIGFIGEEVGKYYPDIVSFDASSSDPSYYVTGMDYSKMTPILLEATKELKIEKDKQITDLQSKIDEQLKMNEAQQGQIDDLKKEIQDLKSRIL